MQNTFSSTTMSKSAIDWVRSRAARLQQWARGLLGVEEADGHAAEDGAAAEQIEEDAVDGAFDESDGDDAEPVDHRVEQVGAAAADGSGGASSSAAGSSVSARQVAGAELVARVYAMFEDAGGTVKFKDVQEQLGTEGVRAAVMSARRHLSRRLPRAAVLCVRCCARTVRLDRSVCTTCPADAVRRVSSRDRP